jgi:hypothetical protein
MALIPFFLNLLGGLAKGVRVSVLYESRIMESGAGLYPITFPAAVEKGYIAGPCLGDDCGLSLA